MSRSRFLPILLAAALVAQSVIAGWGHSHAHVADGTHTHMGATDHSHRHHVDGHHHALDANEHPQQPDRPTDKDDCSICRHLALTAIVTLDLEALFIGDAARPVQDRESVLTSTIPIGVHRPRAPPELV